MHDFNATEWFDWSLLMLTVYNPVVGLTALPGNLLVMYFTVTQSQLRKVPTNCFIFNMAMADFVVTMCLVSQIYALHNPHSILCFIIACSIYPAGCMSFYATALVALSRYVWLCHVGVSMSEAQYKTIFSPKKACLINVACWFFSVVALAPLIVMNVFGPSGMGMCALSIGGDIVISAYFYSTMMAPSMASYGVVIFCYYKMTLWIREKQALLMLHPNPQTESTIAETNALLKMIKIVSILPLFLQIPAFADHLALDFLPHTPIWIGRVAVLFWFMICVVNPWVTLLVVRPYRRALFESKLGKFAILVQRRANAINAAPVHIRININVRGNEDILHVEAQ